MRIEKITHTQMQEQKPTQSQVRLKKRTPIFVICEDIRSLHNVGALFRTSDAALVAEIFLVGTTGRPPDTRIDKTALGATDVVPWRYCPTVVEAINEARARDCFIMALEQTHQSVEYTQAVYQFPLCLIVGSEVAGVSQEALDLCDGAIALPMLGRASSLNVATAFGIALYEILRQYRST